MNAQKEFLKLLSIDVLLTNEDYSRVFKIIYNLDGSKIPLCDVYFVWTEINDDGEELKFSESRRYVKHSGKNWEQVC